MQDEDQSGVPNPPARRVRLVPVWRRRPSCRTTQFRHRRVEPVDMPGRR